jgi:hypothetical protein
MYSDEIDQLYTWKHSAAEEAIRVKARVRIKT